MGSTRRAGGGGIEDVAAPKRRLVSLDAFRGLTILGMLLVNNIALDELTPKTLMHADWSGAVHIADLVFPWFLFAVGVSLPWSIESQRSKGSSASGILRKAMLRTAILIVLGWVVDSAVAGSIVLGLGVLQLIGLSYLFAVLLTFLPWWARCAVATLAMASHWIILRFLPVPGGFTGVISESANAIKYLNDVYLEPLHLRGLLSVLTTGPLVFLGTIFGEALRARRSDAWIRLFVGGIVLVAGSLAVELDLPMNKPLWTASYILYSAGVGALVLGAMHLFFDRPRTAPLALPLVVFGSNAIVAYVAPILFKTLVLRSIAISSGVTLADRLRQWPKEALGQPYGGIAYTACYILFWWLALFFMHRNRLFIRI